MIHSEDGRVALRGSTEDIVDDLTFAMAAVLRNAKCRDKARLMNIGVNLVNNAIDILTEAEKEKTDND